MIHSRAAQRQASDDDPQFDEQHRNYIDTRNDSRERLTHLRQLQRRRWMEVSLSAGAERGESQDSLLLAQPCRGPTFGPGISYPRGKPPLTALLSEQVHSAAIKGRP